MKKNTSQSPRTRRLRRGSFPVRLRLLAALLAATLSLLGCPPASAGLGPRPGLRDYARNARVPLALPGAEGHVDVIGGNLLLRRVDLSIDTRLGTLEIGATYNSALDSWRWSFDPRYGSHQFTDESGASYAVADVSDGEALPGSHWVKLDAQRIKTKSGRVHHFDTTHRLVALTWGQADWPRLDFVGAPVAGRQRTVAIRQCTAASACEAVYDIAYDSAGRVVAIDDRAGRRAEFSWANGRLVAARDGLDVAEGRPGWRYDYTSDRLTTVTNGEEERTEIGYEGGRVIELRRIGEGDPTDRFFYTGEIQGLYATRHWDALGRETVYRYDAERRLHEIWNSTVDEYTRWTWTGLRPTSRTEPDGTTHFFTWSGDDLVRVVPPNGNTQDIVYAPQGIDREDSNQRPVLQSSDTLGLLEQNDYDTAGRRVATRNGEGDETRFGYDADGNLTTVTRPDGHTTELLGYQGPGHPTLIRRPGSLIPEQLRLFDDVGNRIEGAPAGRSGAGGIGERGFDAGRNIRSIALDFDQPIAIDVRSDGRRTRIARPGGDDHEMIYDALGRLALRRERVDGEWQSTRFEYDAVDDRTAVERPNGMRQEYAYDAAGRTVRVRNLRHGVLESEATFHYEGGRLVSSFDSARGADEFYVYDAAGQLAAIQHAGGDTTTYGYDPRGRRAAQAYLDALLGLVRIVHFEHDAKDRVVEIRDGLTTVLEREYTNDRLSEVRYGNGVVRRYGYDPESGALASTESRNVADDVIESTSVVRGLQWPDVHLETTTTTTGNVSATRHERYEMSSLAYQSRFVDRLRVTGYTGVGEPRVLAYDGRSNLLREGDAVFQYNQEGNRLQEIDFGGGGNLDYAYDPAGFVTLRGGTEITWHANGRIASHGLDRFEWDSLGRPLSRTVNGTTSRGAFDGSVTADADGNPLRLDLDEVSIDLQQGGRVYRHLDFRGNVKFTSDDEGEVRSLYTYSPFGLEEVLGDSDDGVRFVMRAEAGELVLMGARVYDPVASRFLSPDPIFQVVNQYAYTLANPIEFQDRDGTSPTDTLDAEARQALIADVMQMIAHAFFLTGAILAVSGNPILGAAFVLAGAIIAFGGAMIGGCRMPRRREELIAGLG